MKQTVIVTSILFLISTALFAQQKCNCEENFKWVKETFEKNDAGFEYALQEKGKEAYAKHNVTILKKIKAATNNDECIDVMLDWLHFFRKAHLGVAYIGKEKVVAGAKPGVWPTIATSDDVIRKNISQKDTLGLEGIWATGNYTIGIIKNEKGYNGVILNAVNSSWKINQVKLEIAKDSSGTYYMGDYSSQKFKKAEFIGSNTLKLGYIYLDKIYPKAPENEVTALYLKELKASAPFIQKLSGETILLRIPSFDGTQKPLIDSLLLANYTLLRTKKNLVIDIRNNGGGDDVSYDNITPLLYTNPIRTINLELFSTPLNNKRMEAYLSIPDLSERSRNQVNDALKVLNSNIGKFINFDSSLVSIQQMDSVFPYPQNVGIIINENNGSTAEQFLLAAKQSKKTKLFGRTTAGVLDISNTYSVESPNKEIRLTYSLSKSLRIPDMKIDNIGIQADYYIDRTIPDEQWLNFVTNILEH